jgi:hypothetical protein
MDSRGTLYAPLLKSVPTFRARTGPIFDDGPRRSEGGGRWLDREGLASLSVCLCVRTSQCSLAPSPQAKVGELKEYLKANKQPQAGEKEDLVARVTLHVRSRSLKIDERDPFDLKPAELRKACAQRGLNPMGERDELLKLLIDAEGGSGGGGGSSGGGAPGDDEATTLVKQVRDTYWNPKGGHSPPPGVCVCASPVFSQLSPRKLPPSICKVPEHVNYRLHCVCVRHSPMLMLRGDDGNPRCLRWRAIIAGFCRFSAPPLRPRHRQPSCASRFRPERALSRPAGFKVSRV